jgi:hypothetical protein
MQIKFILISAALALSSNAACLASPHFQAPFQPPKEPLALNYADIRARLDKSPLPMKPLVNRKVNQVFDKDGDGKIKSEAEKTALVDFYKGFDLNQDGQLQFEEFKNAMDTLKDMKPKKKSKTETETQ